MNLEVAWPLFQLLLGLQVPEEFLREEQVASTFQSYKA